MKPIESEFRYDQFDFKLLKRQGMVCIFQKRKYYKALEATATSHEVVVLRKVPEKTFPNGITTPSHEAMPLSEEWGTYGWTPMPLTPLVEVEKKFEEWVVREEKKELEKSGR